MADAKRRKIEKEKEKADAITEQFEEDSDQSEIDEPLDYNNIEEFLAPHEKELLRQDPFNLNFFITTWTNETTILKAASKFSKWIGDWGRTGIFSRESYYTIVKFCDIDTLFKWRRVCKLTNMFVIQLDEIWRTHFYSRHWKLRHDLENYFFGVDPLLEDKSKWTHVIPDNHVDWFSEYRRNHINSVAIRKAISDMKNKLQSIVAEYGFVKDGVKEPAFFNPGLTDEEIDKRASKLRQPITNDLRELLKCCNGARFIVEDMDTLEVTFVPPIIFPTLDQVSRGMSYARYEKADFNEECSDTSNSEVSGDLAQPLGPVIDPVFPDKPTRREVTDSDWESDSDEYNPSNRASSEADQDSNSGTIAEKSYDDPFGVHEGMMSFLGKKRKYDEFADEMLYSMNDGALISRTCDGEYITYPSITEYLQQVSDFLDETLAPFCIKFNDYEVINSDQALQFMDDFYDIGKGLTVQRWRRAIFETCFIGMTDCTISHRAYQILIAAAQDMLVKIFRRAQALEANEELQLGTFPRAAKELFPEDFIDLDDKLRDYMYPKPVPKPNAPKKKKKCPWV
jgi:hypothetical protein